MGFRKLTTCQKKKKKKSQVCQIFVLEQQILFKIPEPPSFFLYNTEWTHTHIVGIFSTVHDFLSYDLFRNPAQAQKAR